MASNVQNPPRPARQNRWLRGLAGAAMILAGSAILSGLVFISNDTSPLAEHLLFSLGLALNGLISVGAQGLILGGLVMLWTVRRPS